MVSKAHACSADCPWGRHDISLGEGVSPTFAGAVKETLAAARLRGVPLHTPGSHAESVRGFSLTSGPTP